MQKEGPAAGLSRDIQVGSCLIPGSKQKAGKQVTLGMRTPSRPSLGLPGRSDGAGRGQEQVGQFSPVFSPTHTRAWELVLMRSIEEASGKGQEGHKG